MNKIIVVNAFNNGHHPFYLSLIIKGLITHTHVIVLGELTASVRTYLNRFNLESLPVKWIEPAGKSVVDFYTQSLHVAKEECATAVFYAYFDSFLKYVLHEDQPIDHEVTGIWFHPHALDQKYRWIFGFDKRTKYRKSIHRRLRAHSIKTNIRKIFFLDTDAPQRLSNLNQNITSIVLPDPGESNPKMGKATARQYFKLPGEEKTIFLHIGTSEKRKGLSDTIKAFHLGLSDLQFRERALLLRVGKNDKLSSQDRFKLLKLVKLGNALLVEDFVSENDFIEYFSAADIILIPYRKFRFSSGILVNAMNARRPVIASDYGMIGKTVVKTASGSCFRDSSVSSLSKVLIAQCRGTQVTAHRIDTFKEQSNFMHLVADSFHSQG